tara:strand:- start:572 stop:814 length:243 start_codon:yes stop_codon:yes gene_type:complete
MTTYFYFKLTSSYNTSFSTILDARYEIEAILQKLGFQWIDISCSYCLYEAMGDFNLFSLVVERIARIHNIDVLYLKQVNL